MPAMRSANGRDPARVTGGREPVVHCRPDLAPLDGRRAGSMMPGDQQQQPVSAVNRKLKRAIDRVPCAVEVHAVQVEDAVGFDRSRSQPSVPSSVERRSRLRHRRLNRFWLWPQGWSRKRLLRSGLLWLRIWRGRSCLDLLTRERRNRRRDPGPECRLFRAERPHARQRPSVAAPAPARSRTFRRRCWWPRVRRPRRCRSGWRP